MRNIEEIAWDLCELYYKTKPPINKNGNVLYYMAGSLATPPFICADSMQEIMVDNGKIIGMGSIYDIPVEAKNNFSQFRRQINDTDYVYVSGEPSKAFIYNLYDIIPDFDKISSKGKSVLHISDPRDCELGINLVKLTSNGKSIIVPNPIDIIGFKLLQTIGHIQTIQNTTQKLIDEERKKKIIDKQLGDYSRCLLDLQPLISAVSSIYPIETISSRLSEMLVGKEKLDLDILAQIKRDITTSNNQNANDNINMIFESINKSKKL